MVCDERVIELLLSETVVRFEQVQFQTKSPHSVKEYPFYYITLSYLLFAFFNVA